MAIELIKEAVTAGARRSKACEILDISLRTLQRWENGGNDGDQRRGPSEGPENALSEAELALIVAVASSTFFGTFRRPRSSQFLLTMAFTLPFTVERGGEG